MTKADLIKEIEGMKSTLLLMESRIEELEAGGHAGTAPATDEAETAYLRMLARTGGHEAIREYQRGKRRNAPYKTTPHPDPLPMRGEGRRAGGGA